MLRKIPKSLILRVKSKPYYGREFVCCKTELHNIQLYLQYLKRLGETQPSLMDTIMVSLCAAEKEEEWVGVERQPPLSFQFAPRNMAR